MNITVKPNEMQVLDQSGHMTVQWSPYVADEVDNARRVFDEYVGQKHYSAFRVKGDNQQGSRIDAFDPSATKMMLVPQLRGG